MAGRRPLPTAIKKLRGNRGKRKLNPDEPKLEVEAPEIPPGLPGLAQAEWKSIVPQLMELGVLSKIDRAALAAYCCAFASFLRAVQDIDKRGEFIKEPIRDERGLPVRDKNDKILYEEKKNPYRPIANESFRQMKSYLTEFGLSPASRSRLKIEKPKAEDPIEAYLKQSQAAASKSVN